MIGFGNLVGSLSHPVLYLRGVLTQLSPSSDFGENQLLRGLISLSLLLTSHLRIFQHPRVRPFTKCYLGFSLLISRSPPLRVYCQRLVALFALAFASPPAQKALGWPLTTTRRLIMQKAGGHPFGLPHIVGLWLQVLFHSPSRGSFHRSFAVLFTIGCQVVFSLIRWSGLIHAEFHLHRITWDSSRRCLTSHTRLSRSLADFSTSLCSPPNCHIEVPLPQGNKFPWFGLFRVRSPLLTESLRFLFLGLLRCFTSPRIASWDYEFIP